MFVVIDVFVVSLWEFVRVIWINKNLLEWVSKEELELLFESKVRELMIYGEFDFMMREIGIVFNFDFYFFEIEE